jgi:predicted Zn finger-like uncharacterized protein
LRPARLFPQIKALKKAAGVAAWISSEFSLIFFLDMPILADSWCNQGADLWPWNPIRPCEDYSAMVIECAACLRRFKLDESRLRPNGSRVKCTKCGNIFRAFPPLPLSQKPAPENNAEVSHPATQRHDLSAAARIRQYTRIEISVPVSCIPEDSEGNPLTIYMGHITEVSQTGIAVELFCDSIAGPVSLSFINHEGKNIQIKGRVEHTVEKESGHLRIGVCLLGASPAIGHFVTNLVRAHYLAKKFVPN